MTDKIIAQRVHTLLEELDKISNLMVVPSGKPNTLTNLVEHKELISLLSLRAKAVKIQLNLLHTITG